MNRQGKCDTHMRARVCARAHTRTHPHHNVVLFGREKEGNTAIFDNMKGT